MKVINLSYQHCKKSSYFFKDLSFSLERGKVHALHGKNGSGKTLLLSILSKNTPKEAIITGEISSSSVALMKQKFDDEIVPSFTFEENLQFASLKRFPKPFFPLKSPSFIPDFLERFQINPHIPIENLSGGQRQILSLMMKLQRNVDVLLLDEPTATLDEKNALNVFEFIKSLTDMTVLIVCHDKELIYKYVDGAHLTLEVSSSGERDLK